MEKEQYTVGFESDTLCYGKVQLRNPFGSGIPAGITVVCGENGSGKSALGLILEKGRYGFGNRLHFSPDTLKVKRLAFTDIHSLSGMEVTYYHQRMEATMNEYVPTVEEIMRRRNAPADWVDRCKEIGLKEVAQKKINYLSSGELRKLLIVNALLSQPDLLVLDNPYIGLDAASRAEFNASLVKLREKGVSTVMLLCDITEVPDFADNLIILADKEIGRPITDKDKIAAMRQEAEEETAEADAPFSIVEALHAVPDHEIAFEIRNGTARYGDKTIFSGVDWKVRCGECWCLQGRNGSGKSLLLSMICADNPQGYSNDITLFDRRRGSGESIFEIKDRIGFVSPEMQLYFKSADPVREIVVQGKRNSLNRYRPSTPEERTEAMEWLEVLGISHLADAFFSDLSSGEQRLVLLARAFIKHPDLLILDEPFHGLDRKRKSRVKRLIDFLVTRRATTLIFVSHYAEEIPSCVNHFFRLGEE